MDAGGQTDLVEEYTFTVVNPPQFEIVKGTERTQSGSTFTDPTMMDGVDRFYAVGDTYQIAPIEIMNSTTFSTVDGTVNSLRYALNGTLPEGLFVKTTTGVIQVSFTSNDSGKTYLVDLDAVDGSHRATLETMEMRAKYRDIDDPDNADKFGPNNTACLHGIPFDDFNEFDGKYKCNCNDTLFAGNNCQIPIQQVLNCDDGHALVDGECRRFTLAVSSNNTRKTEAGVTYTDPVQMSQTYYIVNEPYRMAPLEIITSSTTPSKGTVENITYTLGPSTRSNFFLSTASGEISFRFDEKDANGPPFQISLYAVDQGGAKRLVETMQMQVTFNDTDVPAYGPSSTDCKNGKRVDVVLFDKNFECDCNSTVFAGATCSEIGPNGQECLNNGKVVDQNQFDGEYTCDCEGTGSFGDNCERSQAEADRTSASIADLEAKRQAEKIRSYTIIGLAVGITAVLIISIVGVWLQRWRRRMQPFDFKAHVEQLVAAGELQIEPDSSQPREIKRSALKTLEVVGKGAFGSVFKALLDESANHGPPEYMVAAKTVLASAASQGATNELLTEATMMAELGNHANIVSIIGVITCGDPLVLVVAYCEHGSLLSMLRKRAAASDALGVMAKIRIGRDTARGMAYLSAKSFVHRDLAARNVLVSSGLIAKIGDFGLSRNVSSDDARDGYYKSVKGQFAVRWTSPEAMATMKYTPASDVWSFGVTLHETYTDGARPYEEMDIATVINKVQSGFRMLQPDGCPNAVYAAMMLCWDENPLSRPSFTDLELLLDDAERDHLNHPAANNNNFVIGKEPGVVEFNYMSASDGVNCESTYSDSILRRVLSSSVETEALTSPLDSLASTRLVGFREAVAIASQHVPYRNSPRLIEAMDASLKFGENLVRRGKAVGLTVDQAAAIHFYSVEALPILQRGKWGVGWLGKPWRQSCY